ncbi:hypothetical protein EMCRGX_G016897 [Ephydatia muelleri]
MRTVEVRQEQTSNFAPYSTKRKGKLKKCQSWSMKLVCLCRQDDDQVPSSASVKETLLQAGLGERSVVLPDIFCTKEEFMQTIMATFPKLKSCGGFEFLRCIPNTKRLEVITPKLAHTPKLLRSIIGSGRVFIRPIQSNLSLEADTSVCSSPEMTEKCQKCGNDVHLNQLRKHVERCTRHDSKSSSEEDNVLASFHSDDAASPVCITSSVEDKSSMQIQQEANFSRTGTTNVESGLLQQGGVMNVESGLVQQSANCKRTQASNVESVSEVLKRLATAINCETTLRITVHRSTVWMDALREAQKQSFCASFLLKVTFFGESSIDDGGPRREFFRLLVLQAGESLLRGDNIKFFSLNVPALVVIASTSLDDLKAVFNEDGPRMLLMECGYFAPLNSLDLKPLILSTILDFHLMLKVKASMDQFLEGLQTLGVLSEVKSQPLLFEPYFLYAKLNIDADILRSILRVDFSENSASKRTTEYSAYCNFNIFIEECNDETADGCTLGDLLSFFTGSSTIPPQGFNKQCTITFNHGSDRLPTASTCSLEIRLPTCHGEDYGSFKDAMVLALKCHDGFGQL